MPIRWPTLFREESNRFLGGIGERSAEHGKLLRCSHPLFVAVSQTVSRPARDTLNRHARFGRGLLQT